MAEEQFRVRYFIDLDWLEANGRSFRTLAESCLCSQCVNRQKKAKKALTAAGLIDTIAGCCAKNSEFITSRMPLLESVFHVFLANGNQPLDLSQLCGQLVEWRGANSRISESTLSRLLASDRYYGIRPEP
jgi:hypothetical protein